MAKNAFPFRAPRLRLSCISCLSWCLFSILVSITSPACAGVLLNEKFDFPDGPLRQSSKSPWSRLQGDPAVVVADHTAILGGGPDASTGYMVRSFTRSPNDQPVTLGLELHFAGPLASGRSSVAFFQLTDEAGKRRRCRLLARTTAGDDAIELGLTAKSTSSAKWSGRELPLAEDHRLVITYDPATGTARLWVNPTAASTTPDVEVRDADKIQPARISLQVDKNWPLGRVLLRRIVVRDDPIAPAPPAAAAADPTPLKSQITDLKSSVTPPAHDHFYIFLLAGQSNMAGRGVVEEIDRTADPRILVQTTDGAWLPATEPLHHDKSVAGVGPGLAFARALLPHLPPGSSIGLIPAAFGGSPIATWRSDYAGKDRWSDGATYFARARDSALRAAHDGRLTAILWNQGEADGGRARKDDGRAYRENLDQLIAEFRTALDQPDLPFIAATLGPWRRPDTPELNQVYLDLPARVPHTAVVDTLSPLLAGRLHNKPADPPHYDSASARLLGAAYAEAALPLLSLSHD